MGVAERYKQKKEEEKRSGQKSAQGGVAYRYKQKRAGEVSKQIAERANAWTAKSNTYLDSYKSRFSSRSGTYKDSYVSDADSWLERLQNDSAALREEQSAITALMNEYRDFLDNDWMQSINDAFSGGNQAHQQAISYAQKDRDYWSQWADEAAYTKYQTDMAEHDRIVNYDVEGAQKQADALKAKISEAEELRKLVNIWDSAGQAVSTPEVENARNRLRAIQDEFGGIDGLRQQYSGLVTDMNRAKRQKEGITLTNEALESAEFSDLSKKQDNISSAKYRYINDPEYRSEYQAALRMSSVENPNGAYDPFSESGLDLMDDTEKAIYNYYYAKDGEAAADKYLGTIQEQLNHRKATGIFKGLEDNTLLEMAFGVSAGIDQWQSGMGSAVNALLGSEGEYRPATYKQMASGMVREDLADTGFKLPDILGGASIAQAGYDAITTSANMFPSIVGATLSNIVAPGSGAVVGGVMMGGSAGGNAYQEMINLGYDQDQAKAYGLLTGASEVALQSILGGISQLGGKVSGNVISKLTSNIDNAVGRVALKLGGNMLSEGMEESLQEILTPWFHSILTGEEFSVNTADVLYSGLLGALTAGVFEGGGTVSEGVNTYKTGKDILSVKDAPQRIEALGQTFSADTVAYQLANRVDENTGAYTMGRLFNEIGATLTEQNVADIRADLESRGIAGKDARILSEAIAAVVEGTELTERQIKALEANDALSSSVIDTLIKPNSTVFQRTMGYDQLLASAEDTTGDNTADTPQQVQREQNQGDITNGETVGVSEENGAQGEWAAPADGKTIRKDTGAVARIKEIASIRDGAVTLRLEDGSQIKAKDLSFGSRGEALVYETVAGMTNDAEAANLLVKEFYRIHTQSPAQAQAYVAGIQEAYRFGSINIPMKELLDSDFASGINVAYRDYAYRMGQHNAGQQIAKKQAAATQSGVTTEKKAGKVHFDRKGRTLDNIREASLKTMEQLSAALGVEFYVYESYENNAGQRVYKDAEGNEMHAPNGYYDPKTGTVHIDLNAGQDGKGTMLFTVAHELTHFIRDWSPAKFRVLANFLIKQYGEQGVSVNQLVQAQVEKAKRNGRTLSWDEAYEEMVADSMETMLTDGNAVQVLADLKGQDQSLWQKICDWFKNLTSDLQKVVDAYRGVKADTIEGRMVADMQDVIVYLQGLYEDALADASENFQRAEKNTTPEGGVKMQTRSVNGDQVVWIENSGFTNTQLKDPNAIAQYIAAHIGEVYKIIESGQRVYIGKDLPGEYTHSKYTSYLQKKNPSTLKAKNRAVSALGEMIEIATNRRWEATKHKLSKDAKYGMYRYDTKFAFPVKDQKGNVTTVKAYDAELLIRNASDGKKYLYDIVNIKEDTANALDLRLKEARKGNHKVATQSDAITDNVAQDGHSVKEKFSARDSAYTDAVNRGEEVNKKFSMREPIERTKNMVALHNLTEDKLRKALELGGFPMPSIAVTKADIPHTNFGDITLVFGRETIDPKIDRKNTVYSADAWTPTFPQIEYEADDAVGSKIHQKLSALDSKVDEFFQYDLRRAKYSNEDNLNRYGGEQGLVQSLLDNYGLKAAFLEEKGTHIPAVMVQKETEGISEQAAARYQQIVEILGTTDPEEIGQIPLKEIREKHGEQLEAVYPGMTKTALRMGRILNQVRAYLELDGAPASAEMVTDSQATRKAVDDAVNQKEFEAWVKELFAGIEKGSGIYNHKPIFTASGNRRSFKQTHLPVTLDNIVKVMAAQNNGNTKNVSGFNGVKTLRAGTAERFKSIDAMHEKEDRLQNLTQEEFDKITDELQNRCYSVIETIDEENGQRGERNSLMRFDIIGEILMEICEGGKYNVSDIQRVFRENNREISDSAAIQVKELLYDVAQMPVNLFEAKPKRVVNFNEIKAAIMPKGINHEIAEGLEKNGVPVLYYADGDNASRLGIINSLDGVRFSDRDPAAGRVNEVLQKENAQLKEDVRYLKELLKLQHTVTGGTKFTKSSLENMAGILMKANNVKGNRAELAGLLNGLYEYIAKGEELTWEGVTEMAQPAVEWLRRNTVIQGSMSEYAQDILRDIRTSRISLDDAQVEEAAYRYGSFNDYRKSMMGSVVIAKDGVPLDTKWQEWASMYPDVFDPDTVATDMPGALADAISSLRNSDMSRVEYAYHTDIIAQDLLQQVYDGYWRVSTLRTAADVKQKEINILKSKHYQRMNDLRQTHRENTEKLKQEHRAEMKRIREKYREASDRQRKEIMDRYDESRKKAVESRNRTAMRHKIQNVVKELNNYLLKGTKERHVPEELKKVVAEALDVVNMDTVGAEERIAKLRAELMKAKTPEKMEEISRKIENVRKMGDNMHDRLRKLKDAYDQLLESDDPIYANAHDEVISTKLDAVLKSVGDTALRDMSMRQLEDVYDMYRVVLGTIRNANKTFKQAKTATITELSAKVMQEVKAVGGEHKYRLSGTGGASEFLWNAMKPVYAFEHIGSDTLTKLFDSVRSGEDVWATDVSEARAFFMEKNKAYGYDSWDMEKQYSFTSSSGMDFKLNLEQIMSLYAYSKRDQAADHLRKGGIVFDPGTEVVEQTKYGIKVKYDVTEATAYNIAPDTLDEIIGKLNADQKAFVDDMQEYLSATMGAKGNEVSMALYGIRLFKEKHYFPLKSAPQYMAKAKEQAQGDVKIKNSGFSKETVTKASNPIVLSRFMDVWSGHVNEMSMYHAFVLPMEDFYRVYNFKTPTSDLGETVSVNSRIQNAYGKGATGYIDQLLKDLNGGARVDSTTGFVNKLIGKFKKGAVFASLSVVVQQPSAIARAAALVDTKYFIGPKIDKQRHKLLWEEVKKYAPVALIKEMGYFDTNMGKSTKDFITSKEYTGFTEKMKALVQDSNYRDEVLSKLPALADEWAWSGIWEAVKRETAAKYSKMDTKSDAFLKLVGERFTEVIVKTQVYDSVLSRSAMMRSKDTGMKMATAFMAEPTTSINMVADALLKGKRGNVKYCRTAIGAVIASQILNSILVSFVYAARDDDEEKSYTEKYITSFTEKSIESLNPASYIPFVKDIVSICRGYTVERSDMAIISDLYDGFKALSSPNKTPYEKVEKFAGSVAQLFGLPLKNIMRDARGIYQTIISFATGEKTTRAGVGYAVKSGLPGWLGGGDTSKQEQLYQALVRGDDQEQIQRTAGRYESQKAAETAMRAAIKEHYTEGDISADTAKKHLVEFCSMSEDDAYWKLQEWEYENDAEDDFRKYDDFLDAVKTGKNLKAVIKRYTDNGVDLKTLRSQITSYYKPLYMEMSRTEKANIKGYLLNAMEQCGDSREDAMEKIANWEYEAQYPEVAERISYTQFKKWESAGKPYGVSVEMFIKVSEYRNDDGQGNSRDQDEVAEFINSLDISKKQKDALWCCFWKFSTLKDAPWH